jgi:hypothetical protein
MNYVSELSQEELCLLAGLRIWVDRIKYHQAGLPYLLDHFGYFNASDAAYSLDAVLNNTGASATRPIEIHCPDCPHLSTDEAGFLHAVACLQILYFEPATNLLNSWMPAAAARLTLEPLQGLARILQLTDIILPLRQWDFMTLTQNDKTTPCIKLH